MVRPILIIYNGLCEACFECGSKEFDYDPIYRVWNINPIKLKLYIKASKVEIQLVDIIYKI